MEAPSPANQLLGSFWLFLALPGSSWLLLAPPGSSWLLLAPPGFSWLFLAPHTVWGRVWTATLNASGAFQAETLCLQRSYLAHPSLLLIL